MVHEEIGRHAGGSQPGEHYGRPAVVIDPFARVVGRMAGVVGVTVLTGRGHHADFDGRIHSLHERDVIGGAQGVGIGVVRHGIAVGFPAAVTFIADFPILETQRRGPRDAQEVFAIVSPQRRGGAQRSPISCRLPVGAFGIHAQGHRAGGRGIAVSHPGGRFLRRAGAVVDGDDGLGIDAGIGDDVDEIRQRRSPSAKCSYADSFRTQ